jgi:hypothetical protein
MQLQTYSGAFAGARSASGATTTLGVPRELYPWTRRLPLLRR